MKNDGFTLIEILLATIILASGLLALMMGLGNSAQMMMLAKEFQDTQFVFSLGERCYPIPPNDEISDPEKDERLNVDPVSADDMINDLEIDLSREARQTFSLYTFERAVDEKELATGEVDDGLYILRTRITRGKGRNSDTEELVRLIRKKK